MEDNQVTTSALGTPSAARELVACWDASAARFDLGDDSMLVIGRGEASDVRIGHSSVSRSHARLHLAVSGTEIEDLGSANGVTVDGIRVQGRARVELGSIIELGVARVVVRAKRTAGTSAIAEVRRVIQRVAPSQVSLILIGETGAGKEIAAEEIHRSSGRTGSLVRLNCAGLAVSLLESELFGHERGAFTGAVQSKPGLIEAAHAGTLFLDELGEMPEATQAKLLRVIESGEVRRIGALDARKIDVRFVAATHRDLRALAAMGKFREDLLFRLNGLTIRVPSLRERRDEIATLAELFLDHAYRSAGKQKPVVSEGARVLLESYRWPGNVRELRNVMNRVALLCEDAQVRVQHLAFDPPVRADVALSSSAAVDPPQSAPGSDEKERIVRALANVGGNQAAAAKALGITPRVLAYRMDKLGLPRPRRGQ